MSIAEQYKAINEFSELYPLLTKDEQREILELMEDVPLPPMRLAEFVREAWRIVEPETPYLHNWHIDAICQHLEAASYGLVRNLIINIAPRHMKSLLVAVFWPCWVWTFLPSSQWMFVAYSGEFASRDSMKRKAIIESGWYQERWGELVKFSKNQQQKTWFENQRKGYMKATGLSGTGMGADFIVGDDLIDPRKSYSNAYRSTANQFWTQTISTRGNNPETTVKVLICQRLHQNDIVGHLGDLEIEGSTAYEKLVIPVEYEEHLAKPTCLGWVDPRKEPKELLWPARFDRSFINRLKIELGSTMTASQLQQRPSAAEGTIISRSSFRTWTPAHVNLNPYTVDAGSIGGVLENVTLPDKFDEMLQSWDCTFKDAAGTDYVVGGVWGRVKSTYYLLDLVRKRMDIVATIAAIKAMSDKWPNAIRKLIEEKANGAAIMRMLRGELAGLTPINPTDSKAGRLNASAPVFESGNIIIPHPRHLPWVRDYMDELCDFPYASNDDQVDMTTQVILHWQKSKAWTR